MATYNYIALNKQGKTCKGSVQADSARAARGQLRDKELTPLDVKAIAEKTPRNIQLFQKKVKGQDIALITRQLATLLTAGTPLASALQSLSEQIDKPNLKHIIDGVHSKVLEGFSLAQAMQTYPHAFSELYTTTIAAGEQTGKLAQMLASLADHTEQQLLMQQKLMQALIYPSVMTLVSIAVISFLLSYVVPNIVHIFTDSHQSLPTITVVLISMSNFIKHFGIYILILFIIAVIGIKYALRNNEKFRFKWDAFLLKIPLIKYLTRLVNTARYARTFAILTSSGIPALDAMRTASQLILNKVMRQSISTATEAVREGSSIHRALAKTGYFNPLSLQLISSGEASGQLADMLNRCAEQQEREIERVIDTLLRLFEPLVIVLMGGIVLFIVMAIMLPIFNMNELVTA